MTSPSAASQNATDDTRSSSPAVEPADGEGAIVEEVQPGTGRYGEAQTSFNGQQEADPEVASRDIKGHRRQKERRLIAKREKAYLDLLDETVKDSVVYAAYGSSNAAPLGESRIGANVWTQSEKEQFFSALARYGRDNLPQIAGSVGTKSEVEARLYLLKLEIGLENGFERRRAEKHISPSDVPAACEVDEECERALEIAANIAATNDEYRGARSERKKHGDFWLIGEGAGASIDALLEEPLDGKRNAEGVDARACSVPLTPSTVFFDVNMLLQLSRDLFMNGPPDSHWNYRTADPNNALASETESSSKGELVNGLNPPFPSEPAIYHSALIHLQDIVRNVTQKLVHATLLQATSRLRAKNDSSPASVVVANDVHVAMDVLGLNLDWKAYWAKLPRRSGLEVYSESVKYREGRTGTKNGVKLTYNEVEAELGLLKRPEQSDWKGKVLPDWPNAEDESEDDTVSGHDTDEEDSDVSSDGIIDVTREKERRKRKRALSPDGFARAEERYMTVLDQKTDRVEDDHLRELLGMDVRRAGQDAEGDLPERPKLKKRSRGETRMDWKDEVDPVVAWEAEYVKKLRMKQDESESDEEASSEEGSELSDPERGSLPGSDEADFQRGEDRMNSSDDEMASDA